MAEAVTVMIDNGARCTVCGAEFKLDLPMDLLEAARQLSAFAEAHDSDAAHWGVDDG